MPRFGPISNSDLEKLKSLLDTQGAFYHVTYSEDDLAQAREEKKNQRIISRPTFSGHMSFLYIDIELKDLMIVRGELERMGFAVGREHPEPIEEIPEYLCPKCGLIANFPGVCPRHSIPLLEFSAYADHKRNSGMPNWLAYFVVCFVVALFAALRSCSGHGMW